ncbi:hypothetical protein HZ989_13335 [Brevundimonas sp. AJA228-03]|uniref:hypothetical protein n=1 Tax=Brevundimonas sp. AJA228-03 TaxID=2752515 RepID=UPI001AE0B53F|nr:hypothetical protein [Brevundimonas sp. AJA228-03]QTN19190.1 hypothetical protein HZ989_13335 [Brevundimonas sp. AJA228-03]
MTDNPFPEMDAYLTHLGLFIHEFARCERALHQLLIFHAGVTDEVAGAIFTGARVDTAKDFINRILDGTGNKETKARLSDPFAQLTLIAGVRNHLVHWGTSHTQGVPDFLISNAHLKPGPGREKEYRASVDDLKNMTMDLFRITVMFTIESQTSPHVPHSTLLELVLPTLGDAWLHKPMQQAPLPTPHRAHEKGQPRPPRSSPP